MPLGRRLDLEDGRREEIGPEEAGQTDGAEDSPGEANHILVVVVKDGLVELGFRILDCEVDNLGTTADRIGGEDSVVDTAAHTVAALSLVQSVDG